MHGSARRGRLGVATPPRAGLSTTLGPDITDYPVINRVADLGLTSATITPHVEAEIKRLLDEVLLRGQFGDNAFQLVAYACALEKEKDTKLLGLILDWSLDRVKADRDAKFHCGRLFLIMGREVLPSIHDGSTFDAGHSPVVGAELFRYYLVERLWREVETSWEAKEAASVAARASSNDIQGNETFKHALESWFDLVDLINDSRKRFVIDEVLIHGVIEKQLSASEPTDREMWYLIALIRPDGTDAKSYQLKGRLATHYFQTRELARSNKITRQSRSNLQTYVLDKLPSTTVLVDAKASNASKHHEAGPSLSTIDQEASLQRAPSQPAKASVSNIQPAPPVTHLPARAPVSELMGPELEQTVIPEFDSSLLKDNRFNVDATTPLSLVVAFFTQIARPTIADYTKELQHGDCDPSPVVGGMSDVWRVKLRKGAHVAVKCVRAPMSGNDKVVKRTVKELAAWSQQQHTNILQLLGIALFKDRVAMVSEWMDQGSIISMVNNRPEVDRYNYCIQMVSVVVWLHNKELIHGDLKGANILVSADGTPKLTDFGLAIMREGVLQFSQTDEGTGTMRWMAPELFDDDARKTYKTDVYALGMTILEILTGRDPFEEIASAHWIPKAVFVHKMTPKRPLCLAESTRRNEVFWQAMRRAWVYEPGQRATAEEIERLLQSAEQDGTGGLMKTPRGRSAGIAPSVADKTQGPNLSYIGAVDRYVAELSLSPQAIPKDIKDRVKTLLEKLARGEDDNHDQYRVVAYASALGGSQDGTLLALVFDLVFETLYEYHSDGKAASIFSDLCQLLIQEILPDVNDGQTRSSAGELFQGRGLARKYLVDRCYTHVNREWAARQESIAKSTTTTGGSRSQSQELDARERWIKLALFIGQLHTSHPRLLDQRIFHWCLKSTLSEDKLTKLEAEAIRSLISNAKAGDLDGMGEQMDEYHRRIHDIVNDDAVDPAARLVFQSWISPWKLLDGSTLDFSQAGLPSTLMSTIKEANKPDVVGTGADQSASDTGAGLSSSLKVAEEKFEITPATPLEAVVAFFRRVSKLDDYTAELSHAQDLEPRSFGGYAEVYRVRIRKNTHLAVKCMRSASVTGGSKAVKRTARELEVWSQLRHENILQLLGLAMFKGCLAMVSAWMELGDIVMFVNDRPSEDRYRLSIQIVGAVVYLHAQKVVHGDIKGANVLVSHDGKPKLADFGLTMMAESKLKLSDTDASTGTLRWMAPELFKSGARRSAESDVYALGMTILETLTGKPPFCEIENSWAVHSAVLMEQKIPQRPGDLLPPSQRNDGFWEALKKSWIHEPSRRAKVAEVEGLMTNAYKLEELGRGAER